MKLTKRQVQKEATKKLIVKTAYNVYAEKGFTATTSDIAKKAQVSHGTIFVHFPTLNDLLIYLLQDFGSEIGARLHELADGTESITDVLETHISVLEEYEDFYSKIITESRILPDEIINIVIAIQSNVSFHFSKAIEFEMTKGRIKKIPLHMIFNTWIGLVHYYLQNGDLFAPNASVLKCCREELISSFVELIKI